jgi:DNA-binding NarL/FixJ family response regulator
VPDGSGPRARVVVVDEQILFAEGLRAALRNHGIDVVGIAARGREGITLAKHTRPEFVLVDMNLSDMDGVAVGRRILADLPETKLMAVAGLSNPEVVRDAIRAGFQGFVMKEASTLELLASMTAVMHTHAVIPHHAAQALAGRHSERQEAELLAQQLTDREREVLALLVDGASGRQMADRLHVSPNTIRTHVQNICSKLLVHSRLEAAAFAVRYGIVPVERHERPTIVTSAPN